MNALIFMVILIVQAIAEKRILLNNPSLLQSQIHAVERKVEDGIGKYTYLSVNTLIYQANTKTYPPINNDQSAKYADLSTRYTDLTSTYNDKFSKHNELSTKYTDLSTNTIRC